MRSAGILISSPLTSQPKRGQPGRGPNTTGQQGHAWGARGPRIWRSGIFRSVSLGAVFGFVTLVAAGNLLAQDDLTKVVVDRHGVMRDIQNAYWPVLAVMNGESTDLAAAAAASQSIQDALGRFSALLLPGTAKGEVPGSRANPEVWSEPAEFAAALNALQAATAALSEAAASGDIDLFKARFDSFASACVGCHALKPSGGGRFRASK